MKNLLIIVVIIVIGLVVWSWLGSSPSVSQVVPASKSSKTVVKTKTPVSSTAPATTQGTTQTTAPTPIVNQSPQPSTGRVFLADQNVTINASDSGADITNITAPKGQRVNLIINVSASGAGHGGLDFRSSIVNTGTIAPGGSIQTGFIADKSFVITPYWPATNTATPYRINVTVQ